MPDKKVYEYAVIRLVPRVEREEFLNVGVLLYCKRKRFLDIKYHLNTKRIAAFAPQMDQEEVAQYLKAWELICQGDAKGGKIAQLEVAERFRWLSAAKSTILQCSKVHTGLTEDATQTIESLFQQYVL